MESSPPLSVVDRFAQIIDGLCVLLIAQLVPQCRVGRRFGGPSRRLVLRFCAELQALSESLRAIAAGIEADRPVVAFSGGGDAAVHGYASADRALALPARVKMRPVVARARNPVGWADVSVSSCCSLGGFLGGSLGDSLGDVAGSGFSRRCAFHTLHAHFVT